MTRAADPMLDLVPALTRVAAGRGDRLPQIIAAVRVG